jgi:hypothetical protein
MISILYDYSTSDEEFNMDEDKDLAMIVSLHKNKNKWPKHIAMGREEF